MKKHLKPDILSKKTRKSEDKNIISFLQIREAQREIRGFAESNTGKARLFLTVTHAKTVSVWPCKIISIPLSP